MEKLKRVCYRGFDKDSAFELSWPRRRFRCSFCKKEFKSAQALGGHMNVHRRDRARLIRLSSPPAPSKSLFYPNPNPSISFKPTKVLVPYNMASLTAVGDSLGLAVGENVERRCVWRGNDQFARLDLGLGLIQDQDHHAKEVDILDLELRLGHSNY